MTSQHDALYRAICTHPNEDTPRLAFADLLEEEGDSQWAAFIRTQVELAKVPEYDPLWVKCRQLEPHAINGHPMVHTLPKPLPAGFSWRDWAFRRGFPWRATVIDPHAITHSGPALFDTAPIQALWVDTRSGVMVLADSPHLARLGRLECSHTRLDAEDTARLGGSEHAANLTELSFDEDGIDANGLRALVESPLFGRLASLELQSNVIVAELLIDALGAVGEPGNLARLALSWCRITRHDAANLFALPVLRELDHLDLSGNSLNADGVEALAESRATCGLRVLNLSRTLPSVTGIRVLTEERSRLTRLRYLDLSRNRLGPVAVRLVAEAAGLRKLRVLNLSNNRVGNDGAVALANSSHLSGLLELNLADAGVGDAGAVALAESPHLENLLRLDLRCRAPGRPLGAPARRALRERFRGRVSFG
jgi:uncharacterized protein (TIGR02996 family)